MRQQASRAIVLGYSLAGKLAARVLADTFQEVIVFEKDSEQENRMPRKGSPQSHHPHVLLKRGANGLETLFPGLTEELLQNGAAVFDFTNDVYWVHHGRQKVRNEGGFRQLSQSRPLLEWLLQRRLNAYSNIHVHDEASAEDFVWSKDGTAVKGVVVKKDGATEKMEGDLIIDTTGASALYKQAFKKQGWALPKEDQIKMDLSYTSRKVKWDDASDKAWRTLILYPQPPRLERGGILYPIEKGEWMVTLFGYGGDRAPADEAGFLAFAKTLCEPDLYEVLKKSEPRSEFKTYRVRKQVWRRMDKMARLPENFLVMGDALCRFDPVFGQGMTAALLEAEELKGMFKNTSSTIGSRRWVKRLYKQFAKRLSPLWLMVTAEDFMYSGTEGKCFVGLKLLQTYLQAVYRLSEYDPAVYKPFSRVLHLLDSPFTLFKPAILLKVLLEKKRP